MKTALELYEAFLVEIDRNNAPDAEVIDFLHAWNSAVYTFLENELIQFESTNIVTDRLRMISTLKKTAVNSASCKAPKKSIDVPEGYYRLFGVVGVLEFARDLSFTYAKGDLLEKPFQKLTADINGFIMDNKFYKPSIKRPFYRVLDNKIHFVYESDLEESSPVFVRDVTLSYVKHPEPLQLSDDFSSYNSSPFPVDVNRLILKYAVIGYMGTTGDSRIQLKSQL